MAKPAKRRFTLIELIIVAAVIGILLGILMPSLSKARQKAKSVRWLAFNALANRDGDTVLNYNFMYDDYAVRSGGTLSPALRNGAVGCTINGFEPKDYDGLLEGGYEWRKGAGRWSGYNSALQFDGISALVRIPGERILNFNPLEGDFTAMAWVSFDKLTSSQTLFSKSDFPVSSQYDLSVKNSKVDATAGGVSNSWKASIPDSRWTHVALVCSNGKTKAFIDGQDLDAAVAAASSGASPQGVLLASSWPLLAQIQGTLPIQLAANNSGTTVAPPSGATTQGQGNAYGIGNGQGQGNTGSSGSGTLPASQNKLLIGGAGLAGGGSSLNFAGRMDEFIFIRRALSPSEVKGQWRMGTPY